jgi:hypothetical protein
MTEAEWLAGTDPAVMLAYLGSAASDRKLRLWACACARRVGPLIPHELGHKALAVVERYVDGLAGERELLAVADAFYPCGQYNPTYDHPATRAAHSPLYRETASQAAIYARRCRRQGQRDAEAAAQAALLRDVFGNPFRTAAIGAGCRAWHGGTIVHLAQAIYEERAFDRLPILADALEDAGCTDAQVLAHCRGSGEHVPGCWVVDLLVGAE